MSTTTHLLTTVAAACLLVGPAFAQDADASAPAVQEEGAFGDIIVTAQRRSERLRDVPLTISAKSGDDLERTGVSNVRELSIAVPGLSFTTQGSFAQPSIRGVQTTVSQAGGDSPVAIYVDGLYQANQLGNLFDLPDIERVEVLKGPQGTLFGRNATAGAVAIHTKSPSMDSVTGKISASAGYFTGSKARDSHDLMLKGYVSTPIVEDKLAMSVAGFYEHIDGYLTDIRTGKRTGEVEKYLVRVKFRFEPTETIRFLLSGSYGKREDQAAAATHPLNGNTSAAFYPGAIVPQKPWQVAGELKDGVSPASDSHRSISLKGEFDIGDIGTLTSLTGYTKVKARTTADIDSAYAPNCLAAFGCIIYDLNYPNKTFQQEFTFASEQFGSLSFVAGAFYYRDNHFIASNINPVLRADGSIDRSQPAAVFLAGRIKTEAWAGFGEVNLDVTDKLRVIGGMRYSWERKKGVDGSYSGGQTFDFPTTGAPSWDSWTPRVSVRYSLSDDANIYATFSKGFKSGVLDSTGLTNDVANPETITSYEAGVKYGDGFISLNAAGFYYDYSDLQVQFFDGTRTLLANAANAELYGFEADAQLNVTDNVRLSLAGSWLPHAKYKNFTAATDFTLPNSPFGMGQAVVDASGMRMLKAPKFTGSAAINYEGDTAWGKLEANANVYYSAGYNWNLSGRVRTKSYALVNGQIALTPNNSAVRVGIFGKNLTNKAYVGGTILAANADGAVWAPPRQIGISVDYSF